MSRQLITTILFATFASIAHAETVAYSTLQELHYQEKTMFQNLENGGLSNAQKLAAIKEQKQNTEMTLQKLIIESEGDPAAEITKRLSPLSIAFKVGDLITVLAQLDLDSSGNFSRESCDQSRSQLYITAQENRGIRPLESLQTKIAGILSNFCGNN